MAGIHLHLDEAWPEMGGAGYNGPYPFRDSKMTDSGKSAKTNEKEKQENLRKKKELIRSNKVQFKTVFRFSGALLKLFI